uniref:Arachidonate 5-lipoxygenase-activating protein n=1 Tax=Salmo trutta TaxID=8032 RepID=A0A673Y1U1_SALTR
RPSAVMSPVTRIVVFSLVSIYLTLLGFFDKDSIHRCEKYFPIRNCMDSYPTFLAVMWCAGLCLNQAPAAFAGLVYLVARQKYFVGYMGQTSQSTPGYLFGKRVLSFLFLMCIVGIFNLLLVRYFGNDFKDTVETITTAASVLLLIP